MLEKLFYYGDYHQYKSPDLCNVSTSVLSGIMIFSDTENYDLCLGSLTLQVTTLASASQITMMRPK